MPRVGTVEPVSRRAKTGDARVMDTPVAWVLADAAAGNRRQAEALARALGVRVVRRVVCRLGPPWSWWAPRGARWLGRALPPAIVDAARTESPALAIGCGRIAAAYTAWLRARHGTYAVQILDPRIDPGHWDVVVCPRHDRRDGPNVIQTLGSIHDFDPQVLGAAARARPDLLSLPRPVTAVLVGGPTRAQRIDADYVEALARRLPAWRCGGSLVVTASRRTPPALVEALRALVGRGPGLVWCGPDDGANPYPALLGVAERIIVTPDSVNLASEACASGRPVHVFAPRPIRGKLARFHEALVTGGHARPMGAAPEAWTPTPLIELPAIAAEVRRRFEAT
jgi:mitochondrial fission protein ELM1